jgi:hypothetical protein
MASVTQRLTTTETFDGKTVTNYPASNDNVVNCDMTPMQESYQTKVRHIWGEVEDYDLERKGKRPEVTTPPNKKGTLSAKIAARLALVHEDCPNAGYGETGLDDSIDKDDNNPEDSFAELISNTLGKKAKGVHNAKKARAAFRKKIRGRGFEHSRGQFGHYPHASLEPSDHAAMRSSSRPIWSRRGRGRSSYVHA